MFKTGKFKTSLPTGVSVFRGIGILPVLHGLEAHATRNGAASGSVSDIGALDFGFVSDCPKRGNRVVVLRISNLVARRCL